MTEIILNDEKRKSILDKIELLYGLEKSEKIYKDILNLMTNFKQRNKNSNSLKSWVDEKDVYLITYGDSIKEDGKSPLRSLIEFSKEHLKGIINNIHILPFYPYSSDDGFSVIDYFAVNPELGDWEDIKDLNEDFTLMFDGVINHISAKSEWFKKYLEGNEEYKDYFVETEYSDELKKVTRPRALPLLTKFKTKNGEKFIWTTFSEDQIDLNFKSEDVLLKIIELILFYIEKGALSLRLDAIGYLWKEIGTNCIHLENTHKVIQLFRDILDAVAPETILITETNVPHKDNISYFGDGHNEAQMVYQFPLPPLVLNALQTGNASYLSKWADSLEQVSDKTTFFNFLASHDGIGVMPAKKILSEEEINEMARKVEQRKGFVSYKNNSDGTKSPYELNINYFDALSEIDDDEELKIKRFINAQSILLSVMGVPAIYIHSLLGSRNYNEGVKETGRNRTINREKLCRTNLEKELSDKNSLRSKIINTYGELIKIRKEQKAFHPNAEQKIVFANDKVLSFIRTSLDKKENILAIHNVSNSEEEIMINLSEYGFKANSLFDLISKEDIEVVDGKLNIKMKPYQVIWLKF